MNHKRLYNLFSSLRQNQRGTFLIVILMFGSVITLIVVGGISSYAIVEHRASARYKESDLAFHIAEAGVDYYRWHLLHAPGDYLDGTGQPGPYIHEYKNKGGQVIGSYTLTITPPPAGSSIITIRSVGETLALPSSKRTVQVKIGFPAVSSYAYVTNANADFGPDDVIHGIVHSNGTIRFDGTSDSWVRSAQDNGIQGGGGPKTFWQSGVVPINFAAISTDVAAIRSLADSGGVHLNSSGVQGWHLVFSGNSFTAKRVLTRDCYNGEGRMRRGRWEGQTYCYDLGTEQVVQNYSIPENGAIFVEDDVWVDGVVDGRVTVAAGRLPLQQGQYRNIYVSGNITYTGGQGDDDVLGLFAQGDVLVPYEVPNNMTIYGALLSQFGKVYRPYYDSNIKTSLSLVGSQMSFLGGTWRSYDGHGNTTSGFDSTTYTYDGNFRFSPPPGFPVQQNAELIGWEEIE